MISSSSFPRPIAPGTSSAGSAESIGYEAAKYHAATSAAATATPSQKAARLRRLMLRILSSVMTIRRIPCGGVRP